MADTPTDGTPETPATKPAPRRRTRSTAAATPKTRRGAPKAAAEASTVKPPRAKPGPKPKPKAAVPATEAKPPRKPRTASAKATSTINAAAKPKNRAKLIVGVTAAAIGLGGAVAAVLGRKKIVAVSGDVMEAVSAKIEDVKPEPGPSSGTIEVPSQSPVPPVS